MNVLIIGGTGIISSACAELAVSRGMDVTLVNRGTSVRPAPQGTRLIKTDIRSPEGLKNALAGRKFDAVVDFLSFVPEQVQLVLDALKNSFGQYVFISSASAYRKPAVALPVVESNLLHNPFWSYSRDKIACEEFLTQAFRENSLPITIVRPSHTYDKTLLPFDGGWNVVERMLHGKPVIVHGDGTSLWTLTYNKDFAVGLVGLLGQTYALGEAFHITSDEWLTWNEIFRIVGKSVGVEPQVLHVPSEIIARFHAEWGAGLLGDKAHSMIFDNSKIKRIVPDFCCSTPFAQGAREIAAWFQGDTQRKKIDVDFETSYQKIIDFMNR